MCLLISWCTFEPPATNEKFHMKNFDEVLAKSIKNGFRTAIIYAVGTFVLGYVFEYAARVAFGFGSVSGDMRVWDLGGFNLGAITRILIFISLLGSYCLYLHDKLESFNRFYILFIVFGIAPVIFGIIPNVLTTGELSVKQSYAISALIAGGVLFNKKHGGNKYFFYLLIMIFALSSVATVFDDFSLWMKVLTELQKSLGSSRTEGAFALAFVVPAGLKLFLNVYVFFLVPQRTATDDLMKIGVSDDVSNS